MVRLASAVLVAPVAGMLLASDIENLAKAGSGMKKDMPFYHTTDEIRSEIRQLASKCPHLQVSERTTDDGSNAIDVVKVRKAGATPSNHAFLLFGEHARELISPESALHFLKTVCGQTEVDAGDLLDHSEFTIIPNGNPKSRRKVEEGAYCLRVNENGVDLNRNWDSHWEAETSMGADTNPGSRPWSEPETRLFKDVASSIEGMTLFLTIHSGTKGMYAPWAYDREHLAKGSEEMLRVLQMVDKDHCQCPFGAAGREVGYSCPGTCLDWVFQNLKPQYSYAFEIYTDRAMDEDLRARWMEKVAQMKQSSLARPAAMLNVTTEDNHFMSSSTADDDFLKQLSQRHFGDDMFKDLFEAHPSSFVQLKSENFLLRNLATTAWSCFRTFNPPDEGEFNDVLNNWSQAYIDMSNEIARKVSERYI